jgi:V-type H+-transporting ATPase subunit a
MSILMFLKWSMPWGTPEYPTSEAPSIIAIFIKMALSPGEWDSSLGKPLYGDEEGKYQAELQYYFLITAAVCAFLILIPKPLILLLKHGGSSAPPAGYAQLDDTNVHEKLLGEDHKEEGQVVQQAPKPAAPAAGGHGHGDHFEFGEVFVHQIIETIEFVLGSISNTASYLRLWALSLAHSQLAKVFYDNTIGSAIVSGNFIVAFAGFVFFAIITFGVLLLMDQMECFLHALRLHWVEFQNKFYKADGYQFEPFSFERTLKQATA